MDRCGDDRVDRDILAVKLAVDLVREDDLAGANESEYGDLPDRPLLKALEDLGLEVDLGLSYRDDDRRGEDLALEWEEDGRGGMDWDGENPIVSISFLLADDAVSALAKLSKKELVVRFRDALRGEICDLSGVLTASILPFMVADANVSALAIRSKKELVVLPLGVTFLGDCCTFPFIVADA